MTEPVKALPSATIVLVREGPSQPEILMVKRRAGDVFGDSYAFPGGVVDHDEHAATTFCDGRSELQANQILQLPLGGLDFYSAVIRELYEETGILLARDVHGAWAFSTHADAQGQLTTVREQLNSGALSWAGVLQQHQLRIACDALHYFSFWETPVVRPKRWAARFFAAAAPPGQDALHDGNELTDSCWMTAAEVLSVGKQRTMKLPFPTLKTLEKLAGYDSVESLLGWAAAQEAQGVVKVQPVVLQDNGNTRLVIPGDPEYPGDINRDE